jgi:hypothetical protein
MNGNAVGNESYKILVAGNGGNVMRLAVLLSLFLLSVPAWAGTFRDDFEDGDWAGWKAIASGIWDTNVGDSVSVADGVLRLDHIHKPGFSLALSTGEDWADYTFSADMRLVRTEPGAKH